MKNKAIYLDYMASTPVDETVKQAMWQAMQNPANPSSPHPVGVEAAAAVERARTQVAESIGADTSAIIWTSGATEANNLAIQGAAHFYQRQGKHLITLASEHKAVLEVMKRLQIEGFEVTVLTPSAEGLVDLQQLANACRVDTRLISIMWVNNETGVIQPIADIARIAKQKGVLLHVDAAQALGKVNIDLRDVPIDLLSLSAHKCYGPKGVGALFVRQQPLVRLQPLLFGGGQENQLRSGTIATHQVVGMGAACALAKAQQMDWTQSIRTLQARLIQGLSALPGVGFHVKKELAVVHCLNWFVRGVSMAALLDRLPDIMIATGSACNSATPEPSPVLLSMGIDAVLAENSARISLGKDLTLADIDYVVQRIASELAYLRAVSPDAVEPLQQPVAPYRHAYRLQTATHQATWRSQTDGCELRLFANIHNQRIEGLSYLLNGSPAWFAVLDLFCAKFADCGLSELQSLTAEAFMQALCLRAEQAHMGHALRLIIQRWMEDDKTQNH